MKPQVSQHFAESCQVTETGLTEAGLQTGSAAFPARDAPLTGVE